MTPERHDSLAGIADEFLQNYTSGPRLIAIEGSDTDVANAFAEDLATVLRERSVDASTHMHEATNGSLREEILAPFRAGRKDAALLVSGHGLLEQDIRNVWHFSIWLIAGDEPPHAAASALVDITDPDAPQRRFSDYCALPDSFLA